VTDLHLDGTHHDPDMVGPQLDADETNDALTTREYVFLFSRPVVGAGGSSLQLLVFSELSLVTKQHNLLLAKGQ